MRPDRRWSENHVIKLGYDSSTVRRSFRRQFGMTVLEMARQRRLREGFETLAVDGKVVTTQHDDSFGSASAFRAAFARLLGNLHLSCNRTSCYGQHGYRRRSAT